MCSRSGTYGKCLFLFTWASGLCFSLSEPLGRLETEQLRSVMRAPLAFKPDSQYNPGPPGLGAMRVIPERANIVHRTPG